jgi:uncharacterized surface protein with fasciclin (FAS1) repeats
MTEVINKSKYAILAVAFAVAALLVFLPARQASAAGTSNPNIAQIAISNGNFTTLVAALQCTGLDKVVSSRWVRVTVFAPTDAAFSSRGFTTENICTAVSKNQLRNILLYHVTWGVKDSTYVLSRSGIWMLNGQRAIIDSSVPSIDGAPINTSLIDIRASNGMIHVINDVMFP